MRDTRPGQAGFGWLYLLLVVVTSGLFGWLYYVAVPVADDLWFSLPYDGHETVRDRFIDALALTCDRWQTDMIRLPNQFVALMLMVCPRWVVAMIVSVLCLGAIEGGRRVIGAGVADWSSYGWIFCFWLCLPWYDYLLSLSYIMNYVFPSAIALWTLYFFSRLCTTAPTGKKYIGVLILAFLTGWAHEGFAVPLAAGMGIYMLFYVLSRHRIPKMYLGVFVALCIGIIIICCSPILGVRASEGGHKVAGMPLWEMLMQLGPSVVAVSVALVVGLIGFARCGKLQMVLTVLLPMCLVAELIAFVFYNGPRTTWAAVLYSLVTVFVVLQTFRSRRWITVAAAALTVVAVPYNLCSSIKAQTALSREVIEVTERYSESSNGEVYYDVTTPKVDATLFKTTVRVLNERVPLEFIESFNNERYADGELKKLSILPSRLVGFEGLTFDPGYEGQRIGVFRNLVVADPVYEEALGRRVPLMLVDRNGKEVESRYRISSFHTADGQRYLILFPHAQTLDPTLEIESARLIL